MPAACSLSGRLSTRKASTTMSCVEDIVATSSAPSATNSGERAGSVSASSRIAPISSSCENTSQPRRRPKRAREERHMQRIDQRRPQEFQRVGRADQREQPDGAEIDAGLAHPHQQRRSRQRQRQPGGKAEQQHDQHARLQIDGEAVAPGGAGSGGCSVAVGSCGFGCGHERVLADSDQQKTVIARLDRAIQYSRGLSEVPSDSGNLRVKIDPVRIVFLDERNIFQARGHFFSRFSRWIACSISSKTSK